MTSKAAIKIKTFFLENSTLRLQEIFLIIVLNHFQFAFLFLLTKLTVTILNLVLNSYCILPDMRWEGIFCNLLSLVRIKLKDRN